MSCDFVRQGLREIERINGIAGLADEIAERAASGKAFLFAKEDNRFLICSPQPRGNTYALLIEAAWCKAGDGFTEHHPLVEKLAADIDCKYIEFHTTRKGFERVAPRYGYIRCGHNERGQMIWRRPLWAAAVAAEK